MNTFLSTGIILKRTDTGELDRIVTVFTKEYGKLTCVAKGSRKLTSSRLAVLEPGSLVRLHMVKTRSLPILTQAQLLEDFHSSRASLSSIRKLFEVLEMLDVLLVEEDEQAEVFSIALAMLSALQAEETNKTVVVRSAFTRILEHLGFDAGKSQLYGSMSDHIEELTARKLKAFAFLSHSN